jgi:uncharacterized protein (DUF3084 family)
MSSNDRQRNQLLDAGQPQSELREADLEPREAELERREAELERREAAVEAREAAHAELVNTAQTVLDAANERDTVSDARQAEAEKRESDLDRSELMDPTSDYGADWPERRNAHLDRAHAYGDRVASHHDRIALTKGDQEPDTDRM